MVKKYRLYVLLLAPLYLVGCADDDDALYGPPPQPGRLPPPPQYTQAPPPEPVPQPGGDSVPGPDMGTPPPPDGAPQPQGPPPSVVDQGPGPGPGPGVYAPGPPPPPRVEFVPRPPFYGAVWIPGHWVWNGHRWFWSHGYYRRRHPVVVY